jgi:FkbM family methyltransferase
MKGIRKILVKIIGLRAYLKLVSKSYLFLIKMGLLHKDYPELLFLYDLIKPTDNVIDIGANLGYYSKQIKKIQKGSTGSLLAVEPIPLFASVWRSNVGESSQIRLENSALGSTNETVRMGIPIVDGVVRHGLTKVIEKGDDHSNTREYDVQMKIGDEVVASWGRDVIHFIKCDVEGYEQFVIPNLKETILKNFPIFQIELGGVENRTNVVQFLIDLKYEIYILSEMKLHKIEQSQIFDVDQDFYFIHSDKKNNHLELIKN